MTMKGKEKKESIRVTRSKSPARGQSAVVQASLSPPATTPSKQQSRGRSRSKSPARTPARSSRSRSPARTPAKASSSKSEPVLRVSRKSEPVPSVRDIEVLKTAKVANVEESTIVKTFHKSEVVYEEKLTRSATRAAAAAAVTTSGGTESSILTQRKREAVSSASSTVEEVTSEASVTKQQPKSTGLTPFVHQIFSGIVVVALLSVVLASSLSCTLKQCSLSKLPSLSSVKSATYFDWKAVMIVVGGLVLKLLLASLPIGWRRSGSISPDGSRIQYRCNGLFELVFLFVALAAFHHFKLPVFEQFKALFIPLLVAQIGLAFIVSLWCHVRAQRLTANQLSASAPTRSGLAAFVFGREVQPQLGPLNIKVFGVVHVAFLGWATVLGILVHHAFVTPPINTPFAIVAGLQFLYILDFIVFESSMSNSLMISYDSMGFVTVIMTFVWMPFVHTIQLRHLLLVKKPEPSYTLIGVSVTLFVVGYFIARLANNTKDKFRQQPPKITFSPHQLVLTTSGKPLLASGLWGLSRHPNYFGCLLMVVAWSIQCGLDSPLTYAYILYMFVMFALRAWRDGLVCQQKHGSIAWNQYCQRVRSRIIPFIY